MNTHFFPALKLALITMVLFGVVYPLLIAGIAFVAGPNRGEGQTIVEADRVVGFELIGQSFDSEIYFQGRPSAVNYNAAATGGSNKGPTNPEYLKVVEERITAFQEKNPGVEKREIPVDMVTASGGGLDPHISPMAARIQVARISRARNIDEARLIELVNEHTEEPLLGLFGPPRVNVLRLNLALDKLK